jgi:choline dehydrogenase
LSADPCLRSTKGAYDKWADEVGDQSYSFENVQPYLEKSWAFTPPNYEKRGAGGSVSYDPNAFTSSGGPLHISYSNFWQPMSNFVRSAFNKLGLKEIKGFNSGELIGFAEYTLSVDPTASTRSSSETSFLRTALASTSLMVYQSTLAKKILFDSQKTATGVTVVTAGETYTISARKEVILSAGSVGTPKFVARTRLATDN